MSVSPSLDDDSNPTTNHHRPYSPRFMDEFSEFRLVPRASQPLYQYQPPGGENVDSLLRDATGMNVNQVNPSMELVELG